MSTLPFLSSPGTKTRLLRSLQHMEPLRGRKGRLAPGGQYARSNRRKKFVHPDQRIAFWNILPGDEVRVRTGGVRKIGPDGKPTGEKVPYEGVVESIDRTRNVAWLVAKEKGDPTLVPRAKKHAIPTLLDPAKGIEGGLTPNMMFKPKAVQYSNLQLKIPVDTVFDKNSEVKDLLDLKAGVYAKRVERSKPIYSPKSGLYKWKRKAIVDTDKGPIGILVPFKKEERRVGPLRDYTTAGYAVKQETWIPWSPTKPVWLMPGRPRYSPHAMSAMLRQLAERAQGAMAKGADSRGRITLADAAQRKASEAQRAVLEEALKNGERESAKGGDDLSAVSVDFAELKPEMLPGVVQKRDTLPVYAGFAKQLLSKVKRPLVPQPASPAETVWMTRYDLRRWNTKQSIAAAQANSDDGAVVDTLEPPAFTALDYLDVAPIGGPESSMWHSVPDKSSGTLIRDISGRLLNPQSVMKNDVGRWPLELLMANELSNPHGRNQLHRRWKARQVDLKAEQERKALEQRENLKALRAHKL